MRRMLSAVITACMFLPVAGIAQQEQQGQPPVQQNDQAQTGKAGHYGKHKGHERGMAMMAEKLNLTDQQKQQMQQLRQQNKEQAKTIRDDKSLSDADKQAKLKELHKQAHEQMMGLLTPEQKEQMKQMRQEHRKNAEPKNTEPKTN